MASHKERPLLTLEIETLAAGGEGVARLEGRVWFVAGGLPGDRVHARIQEQKDRWGRAAITRMLQPSASRRDPPCPVAGRCGGCPWMALPDPLQAQAKQTLVEEALARVAGLSRSLVQPIRTSPEVLGYRNRLRLRVEGSSIGFRQASSSTCIDIPSCAVASPAVGGLLSAVRQALRPLLPLKFPHQLELQEEEGGGLQVALIGPQAQRLTGLVLPPALTGRSLALQCISRPLREDEPPFLPFQQASFAQNVAMRTYVAEALELHPLARVLDLYCGAGNFSLPLLDEALEVVGIEQNELALEKARSRAGGRGRWRAGDSVMEVRRLVSAGEHFERVVLDPPRTGALEVVKQLRALQPERVVYISCDPATLARDLKELVKSGFSVVRVQPFDLMPQTAHVESIAVVQGRG